MGAAILEAAKKAYLKTQGKSDDAVPSKPEKSIHLVTSANPVPWTGDGLASVNVIKTGTETDCKHVLKFDTQADHTILTDSAFFPDGFDTTNVLEISTITPGPRPRTSGCGTADGPSTSPTRTSISAATTTSSPPASSKG